MIKNLTPHTINVFTGDSHNFSLPSEGKLRCSTKSVLKGYVSHNDKQVEIRDLKYGEVLNLPSRLDGVFYVVSRVVAEATRKLHLLTGG